jgi:hypothetical protein
MRDLHNNVDAVNALTTATISSNTTTEGIAVDLQGYDSVEIFVKAGTITDGAYALGIEECDTSGGTYTAVAAPQLLGGGQSFASTDDNAIKHVGYAGAKRFIKLTIVSTGTTSGGSFGAVAVTSRKRHTGGQAV